MLLVVGVFTPVGVLVVPEWGRGRLARGESVWRVVCGAIGSAALAGVPAKMAQDRADSDGFPANAAAAVAALWLVGPGPVGLAGRTCGSHVSGAGEASGGCGCGCGGMVCQRFSWVSLGLGWFWAGFGEKPS